MENIKKNRNWLIVIMLVGMCCLAYYFFNKHNTLRTPYIQDKTDINDRVIDPVLLNLLPNPNINIVDKISCIEASLKVAELNTTNTCITTGSTKIYYNKEDNSCMIQIPNISWDNMNSVCHYANSVLDVVNNKHMLVECFTIPGFGQSSSYLDNTEELVKSISSNDFHQKILSLNKYLIEPNQGIMGLIYPGPEGFSSIDEKSFNKWEDLSVIAYRVKKDSILTPYYNGCGESTKPNKDGQFLLKLFPGEYNLFVKNELNNKYYANNKDGTWEGWYKINVGINNFIKQDFNFDKSKSTNERITNMYGGGEGYKISWPTDWDSSDGDYYFMILKNKNRTSQIKIFTQSNSSFYNQPGNTNKPIVDYTKYSNINDYINDFKITLIPKDQIKDYLNKVEFMYIGGKDLVVLKELAKKGPEDTIIDHYKFIYNNQLFDIEIVSKNMEYYKLDSESIKNILLNFKLN